MPILPKRLLSIDVLRALTMFLMIFVNDASGVRHIPGWIDHAAANEDAMGFADIIFPAFLFIVGLSIPLAIKSRIKKGDTPLQLAFYILTRSAALLIMGFYHVNLEDYSAAATLPKAVWALLITVAFFLIWLDYPETMQKLKKYLLISAGIVLLIAMAVLYKGGNVAAPTGMHPSWWGILGIIGWSYLVCASVYLLVKDRLVILVTVLAVFVAINIASHTGILKGHVWVVGDGSSASLTMGGIVITELYAYLTLHGKVNRLWSLLAAIGALLIVAGLIIRPYAEGISKIYSTPAWIFICAGITILVFELFIYIVDVKGYKNFLSTIRPAGTSTLTCYLMPYFQVYLMQLFNINYPSVLNYGLGGLLRSFAVSFILIWIVGAMEKKRLKLKI